MIADDVLDRIPLLRDLNARARREVAARSVLVRRSPGETFWRAGDEPRGLLIVLEGGVRLIRSGEGGRTQVVHREGPGATLGEVPLLAGGGYPATAEAAEPTTALLISGDAVQAALAADPALATVLLASLARRVRHLVDRLEALAFLDVRSRLARLLLLRARADGGAGDAPFDLGATHAHIAAELGTVREVVARQLTGLRRRGIIAAAGRGRYRITNEPALEALAEG